MGLRVPCRRRVGAVVDGDVRQQRAAEDAAARFRRAIAAAGVVPAAVTTDCAAAYPAAPAAVLPVAAHEVGTLVRQRIERGQQHRTGRICGLRGFETPVGTRVPCRAHAFLRNLRGHCYDFGHLVDAATPAPVPPPVRAWDALPADLLGR